MQKPADIGLIGLAVMGRNLALNIADHGFCVAVYNRTASVTDELLHSNPQSALIACHSVAQLCRQLAPPRRILLMVKAGQPVDDTISALLPLLDAGDIIIDGGNSHFADSERRYRQLQAQGIRYIGAGISGGESGARSGPSIMPGGDASAWPIVQPVLQAIAADVDSQPCCEWIGPGAAGHYVKMVHNGIEYGDMQLISEAYALLRFGLGLPATDLQALFSRWNNGVLDSYLMQITADILGEYDGDSLLLDRIIDSAGQKGTGRWTAIDALDNGTALTLITEAVFARSLSADKARRLTSEALYRPEHGQARVDTSAAIHAIHDALYAGKIISYCQGFMQLQQAACSHDWPLDYAAIARLWRGGCIIRSRFLNDIARAFSRQPAPDHLLLDDFFYQALLASQQGLRNSVKLAIDCRIATPAMASALAFFDGLCTGHSAANLLQAQRDYFGAHGFLRYDRPAGETCHHDWQHNKGADHA